jgi:hypothetical protein
MNIKEKFLELTSRTYPHGTEEELYPLLYSNVNIPELQKDEFGNLFLKIGESDTMFASHLDTATSALTTVTHVFEDNIIKTDGKSILGADDKAGVAIMLYMIENKIPGLYYFFYGEEVGCLGSRKVADAKRIENIKKVISFDRRGTDSIITYQASKRTASDAFGNALAKELNDIEPTFKYDIDPTGVSTDSARFISVYSECTNISVGYYNEHTFSEKQDIEHLVKLAKACLKVNWNDLPAERDYTKTEWKSYTNTHNNYHSNYYNNINSRYAYDDYGDYEYERAYGYNTKKPKQPEKKTEKLYFIDKKYNYVSCLVVDENRNVVSVDLTEERIDYEKIIITDFLNSLDLEFDGLLWDGLNLSVLYNDKEVETSETDRNELVKFLPELDYRDGEDLDEYLEFEYFGSY